MGSFNTSCFASRQTISPTNKCRIIVLAQNQSYHPSLVHLQPATTPLHGITSSTCYPNRFWVPVSAWLEATYADYGRFQLCDTPLNRYILFNFLYTALSHIPNTTPLDSHGSPYDLEDVFNLEAHLQANKPLLHTLLTGQPPTIDVATNSQLFAEMHTAWNYIFDALDSGLFWTTTPSTPRPLQVAVLHDDSFLALSELACSTTPPRSLRSYFDSFLNQATQDANNLASPSGFPSAQFLFLDAFHSQLKRLTPGNSGSIPGERNRLESACTAHLNNRISIDQMFLQISPWIQMRLVESALEALNLHFEPMVYAPQDYSNSIGTDYARFVSKMAEKITPSP